MGTLGIYEHAVKRGLEAVGPRPWKTADLARFFRMFDEAFVSRLGLSCRAVEVTDWLRSLSAHDHEEVFERLNGRMS